MRRLLVVLLLFGCDRPAAPPAGREVVDGRGKAVRVPARPERIVSIVPSLTEMLFRVGAGDQVAGVTTACDYPPEVASKPRVGGVVVNTEALLALKPDLVVTCARMTRQTTADLEARGLPVFSLDPMSFDEIARTLRLLGDLTGRPEGGERAAAEFLARAGPVRPESGPTFYIEHSADPLGTTGPETYAGEALRRAGGRNVFDGGWRFIDWESVLAHDPEVILIAHDARAGVERRAGWKELKAVKAGRVHFVDKTHYVYPTPRLLDGLEEAARLFHAPPK